MIIKKKTFVLFLVALAGSLAVAAAQQTGIVNAQVETRSAAAGLKATVESLAKAQSGSAWVSYEVPMVEGEHSVCCYSSENSRCQCSLERQKGNYFDSSDGDGAVLEGARNVRVFLRFTGGAVQKVRAFSEDCKVDVGGLPLYRLTDVREEESVTYLSSLVRSLPESERKKFSKQSNVLMAIALHKGAAADSALEHFVAPGQPRKVRKQAAFWLGSARGRRGYEILTRVVENDADDKFRQDAVFALHISKEPEAVDTLIALARNDRSRPVRQQAIFWLGQRAGKKAVAALTDVVENDPDTDIKKRAVFALSQLPDDEGVPLLMKVARTHRNPAIRKKAMFWLGQSGDPRALDFFEEVLTRR